MKLIDLNRERDIGSSAIYVEIGPFKVQIDAGMHPKKNNSDAIPNFDLVNDYTLDLIILTHCHLDHIGSLPIVFKKQPQARIITSQPSKIISARMLRNSHHIMCLQKLERKNKHHALFGKKDIIRTEKNLLGVPYESSRFFIKKNHVIKITLYPSGHLAGACGCLLEYKNRKIFITGDVQLVDQCILPGARFPNINLDTLIIETTKGSIGQNNNYNRNHEIDNLISFVNNTLSNGGLCLIPVFALGRMQEMLAVFHKARRQGKLKSCSIYCSGLGVELMNYFDFIARRIGLLNFSKNIMSELKMEPFNDRPKPGQNLKKKGIYLLGSGMLIENTPSYTVASSIVEFSSNGICFVGYCDPDTPGGKLLEVGHSEMFAFNQLNYRCRVEAKIKNFNFSSHADRKDIMNFILQYNPRSIVLTHGDSGSRNWFSNSIKKSLPKCRVIDPTPNKIIYI